MSTDYEAVCDICKVGVHAGQVSAGIPGFGYSSKDYAGHAVVAAFVMAHAECNPHEGVRIVVGDQTGSPRHEKYKTIEYEDVEEHLEIVEAARFATEIAEASR